MVLEALLKQMVANELTNGNLEDAEDFIQTAVVMNTPLCDVFNDLHEHMEEEGDNYCFI